MRNTRQDHAARVEFLVVPPALPWTDDVADEIGILCFIVDEDDVLVARRALRDGRLGAEAV